MLHKFLYTQKGVRATSSKISGYSTLIKILCKCKSVVFLLIFFLQIVKVFYSVFACHYWGIAFTVSEQFISI